MRRGGYRVPTTLITHDRRVMMHELELKESWEGRILVSGEEREGGVVVHWLDSDEAYHAFVERLPKHRIQMKQPAPPSDDPLLRKPAVDFTRDVLVVAVRWHMYEGPRITHVTPNGDTLQVAVDIADGGRKVLASRADVGTYQAVRVARLDGVRGVVLVEGTHVG